MQQYDLSVILPSRNEIFLKNTVEDILKNKRGKTEIIAVLDGAWADPPLVQHPDVNVIYLNKSIGQRAATNLGVKLSRSRFVMKLDSHCSWDEGHDVKMLETFKKTGDNVTMVGIMRNLWAFDWKCYKCGLRIYQDKVPYCHVCKTGDHMKRKMLWYGKPNPQSTSYSFDSEPHFQYNEDWKHREQYQKDKKELGYTETMSLQGSCFMLTRENYWKWGVCDEKAGSWGNQGVELACATWLSGGRVLVNHSTWYAHMFRTKGDVFGFPWPASGRETQRTKQYIRDKFWNMKHEGQIYPVSWLVKKFWPVSGWSQEAFDALKK